MTYNELHLKVVLSMNHCNKARMQEINKATIGGIVITLIPTPIIINILVIHLNIFSNLSKVTIRGFQPSHCIVIILDILISQFPILILNNGLLDHKNYES